jgi:hypothetical protein
MSWHGFGDVAHWLVVKSFFYYPNIHPSKGSISSNHPISLTKFIFDDYFRNIQGRIFPNRKDKRREPFRISHSFISLSLYIYMWLQKRTRFCQKKNTNLQIPSLDSVSRWKDIYPHILEHNPWNFHSRVPRYISENNTLRKLILKVN